MKYKRLIEIILFFLVCIFISFFYFKYFHKSFFKENLDHKTIEQKSNTENSNKNTVTNLYYENYDLEGNRYVIISKTGNFDNENNQQMLMNDVTAFIELSEGGRINLKSDNAKYNLVSSDTNFLKNVYLDYLKHKVYADNIDVLFEANKLNAYNNVIYKNLDLNLIADKVEIDLISKDTKISNFDESKIKVFKKN